MTRISATTALSLVLLFAISVPAQDDSAPFSLIVLPDTQYYCRQYPDVFHAQTRWIAENIAKLNIRMVIGVGDITDTDSEAEWAVADAVMARLDGLVPYSLAVGNHDMPGIAETRDTARYNRTFSLERYQRLPGWGGRMGADNDNHWFTFRAGGRDFMLLTVEFGPTDDILVWAGDVIADHPDHLVILTTHCYMNFDNTRVGNEDGGRPQQYGVGGNDGQMIYEKLVRKHPNIFLVLSGHMVGEESQGLLVERRSGRNPLIQILTNYQDRPWGGSGWLKIITFIPEQNEIVVSAFSPWLNRHNDDVRHTYRLDFPLTR